LVIPILFNQELLTESQADHMPRRTSRETQPVGTGDQPRTTTTNTFPQPVKIADKNFVPVVYFSVAQTL
jgi:hypothetical protein